MSGLLRGDLGPSTVSQEGLQNDSNRITVTFELAFYAILIASYGSFFGELH